MSCACTLASRRQFLRTTTAAAGGLLAAGCAPDATAPPAGPPPSDRFAVVLLGTRAGPPPDPGRSGIASAVVVDGHVYLVDCGQSAVAQFARAGLSLADLRAVFLTHLHVDHVADYPNLFLLGGWAPAGRIGLGGPVAVYGPGPAGFLPPSPPGTPVLHPQDPTPGTRGLTELAFAAYAYSSNLFVRDSAVRDVRTLAEVHEIALPAVGAGADDPAPQMDPFVVMQDERVRVSAVLVPHGPVFPAFAFRFDTAHGSVTFSGDTAATPNVAHLADRTDLLVHEAINVEGFTGPPPVLAHLIAGHTPVQGVGRVAAAARAGRLVLSHVGEPSGAELDEARWVGWARTGYAGPVALGADLQRITLA